MTSDYQPHFEHSQPRHREGPIPSDAIEGEADLPPELRTRWENGRDRHGKAFSAFLTLRSIDIRATDIVDQFESFYRGTYPDVRAFADSFIEAMGWQAGLETLVRGDQEFNWLLRWNYDEIEQRLR